MEYKYTFFPRLNMELYTFVQSENSCDRFIASYTHNSMIIYGRPWRECLSRHSKYTPVSGQNKI